MADEPASRPGRDDLGGLNCQVPHCLHVIRAMTGLQEIEKLDLHLQKVHMVRYTTGELLDLRLRWEEKP